MKANGKTSNQLVNPATIFEALENALDSQIESILSRNRDDLVQATAELERLVDRYQIAILNQQISENGGGLKIETREATHRVRQKIRKAQRLIEASLQFFEEQIAHFGRLGSDGEYTASGRSGAPDPVHAIVEVRT
jgi:hypothetical protein